MTGSQKLALILVSLGVVVLLGLGSWAMWAPCGFCGTTARTDGGENQPVATGEMEIGTSVLKTLLEAKVPLVLLDARGARPERIPGAIPLALNADEDVVKNAVPSTDTLVVTYCGSLKCPLSVRLAKRLREMGYENVLEYRPGIKGWIEAGGAVEQAG
jgi:rhodanese-related sulfurtransferase